MHERRSRPRRVYLTSKASHNELKRMLEHHHELLHRTLERLEKVMSAFDDLEAAVTRMEGVQASTVTLLNELSREIGLITNGTQAAALAARVTASADALAAAVEANPDPNPDN